MYSEPMWMVARWWLDCVVMPIGAINLVLLFGWMVWYGIRVNRP